MYQILEENIKYRCKDKWYTVTAVLSTGSGGKTVDYITEDGTIIKTQAYCRSKYSKEVNK